MPKGGARTRSGSSASPDSLRRERDWGQWTRLPAERLGPIPDWPAEVQDPSPDELAMWQRLWRAPQALVWEADGVADTVAMYVRAFLEAAAPGASGNSRTVVRQLQDALLLSIPALHSARYVIDRKLAGARAGLERPGDEPAPVEDQQHGSDDEHGEQATGTTGPPKRRVRDRLGSNVVAFTAPTPDGGPG